MSAVLGGPAVSGWGGDDTPFVQISQAPHSKQVLGSLEGKQCGDRPVPPGVAAVPGACRRGGAWPRGAGGQCRVVADGGSWRRQSGGRDNGGIVRWRRSAQLGTARRGSAQDPVPAAGHRLAPLGLRGDGVPLLPAGDRGAASGGPGWPRPAVPPTMAVGARGGLCSRLCSHQPRSEEAATGGGSELLAPNLRGRVGPVGSCLLEPAGEGWPVWLAAEEDVN